MEKRVCGGHKKDLFISVSAMMLNGGKVLCH